MTADHWPFRGASGIELVERDWTLPAGASAATATARARYEKEEGGRRIYEELGMTRPRRGRPWDRRKEWGEKEGRRPHRRIGFPRRFSRRIVSIIYRGDRRREGAAEPRGWRGGGSSGGGANRGSGDGREGSSARHDALDIETLT